MIIKICGITSLPAALAAQEGGADWIGFVFAASRRRITPVQAKEIAVQVKGVKKVGVFVNQSFDEICDIAEYCQLDYVQLHGDETEQDCQRIPCPIIKVLRITPGVSAELPGPFAAWTLFDTAIPGQYGGTGQTFDWDAVCSLRRACRTPILVAGGLTAENVGLAINALRPDGVDVSGGVETNGTKDPAKIARFIAAVRAAERMMRSVR